MLLELTTGDELGLPEHAEVGVVVEQHAPGFGVRVVHGGVPDGAAPQDGIAGLSHQLDVVRHILEGVVLRGRAVDFVTPRNDAKWCGLLVHVVDEEENLDLHVWCLAGPHPFPSLAVLCTPLVRPVIGPGRGSIAVDFLAIAVPLAVRPGARRLDVQGIVLHPYVWSHESLEYGHRRGMLQKIDEDIAVRRDGHDYMGCFADSVTVVVDAFHELSSPILASCLFNTGKLLLQLRQLFTLDQAFELDVTSFIETFALSVV